MHMHKPHPTRQRRDELVYWTVFEVALDMELVINFSYTDRIFKEEHLSQKVKIIIISVFIQQW